MNTQIPDALTKDHGSDDQNALYGPASCHDHRPKSTFAELLDQAAIPVAEYDDPNYDTAGKAARKEALSAALLIFHQSPTEALQSEADYAAIVRCFARSCFRTLPPAKNPSGNEYDPEEDDPILCPAWPALSLVYELMLRVLDYPQADLDALRGLIGMPFAHALINLFDNEDPREREAAKTILHRVYGKLLPLRASIRRAIQAVFLETVHCGTLHKLAELLEIFGSIINGFAIPLREEHRMDLLQHSLLPLHKCRHLSTFYPQLAYCVVQFVEKEPGLAPVVIIYLLRCWPCTNSLKEVLFLGELEEVIDLMDRGLFRGISNAVISRLAKCLKSGHFQVAERTLLLLTQNEHMAALLSDPQCYKQAASVLGEALAWAARYHWNRNVQMLSMAALSGLSHIDPMIYGEQRDMWMGYKFGESHDTGMARRKDDEREAGPVSSDRRSPPNKTP